MRLFFFLGTGGAISRQPVAFLEKIEWVFYFWRLPPPALRSVANGSTFFRGRKTLLEYAPRSGGPPPACKSDPSMFSPTIGPLPEAVFSFPTLYFPGGSVGFPLHSAGVKPSTISLRLFPPLFSCKFYPPFFFTTIDSAPMYRILGLA